MELNLKAPMLTLETGEVLSLDDARGACIRARTGTVWVTEEGSRADHIVGPGDTLLVESRGRTVVQALQTAWISIREGCAAANDPSTVERAPDHPPEEHVFTFGERMLTRYY
jgi:hypothetical protein